jgi:hypothetical protein
VSRQPTSSLFIRLGPSRQLVIVLGALHAGAIPCAFANDLAPAVQGLLTVLVLLSGVRCIVLHGLRRAARSIVLVIWDRHGHWRLLQRDGTLLDVRLEYGAYAHPQLLVLPFRDASGRRACVLMVPDMVDGDCLRRLRTRLRCEFPEYA